MKALRVIVILVVYLVIAKLTVPLAHIMGFYLTPYNDILFYLIWALFILPLLIMIAFAYVCFVVLVVAKLLSK